MIGVYAFIPKYSMTPEYIGVSKNVEKRVRTHVTQKRDFTRGDPWIVYQPFDNYNSAHNEEQRLINLYHPRYNWVNREKIITSIYKCEVMEELLEGYEHPPWRPMSMLDQIDYKIARDKWIERGRNMNE